MDFHNLKRKELQALCKKHNIPANLSNSQMALNLSSLLQEKEKTTKRGRASSKASVGTVEEKDSSIPIRLSKKVRFGSTNETFEYLELRSGRKEKTKVTRTMSSTKAAASKGGNPVEKVDNNSSKEIRGRTVRYLRSRVLTTGEGSVVPEIKSPGGIKRVRRAGKDADNADSTEEIVIKPVRVTRSRGQKTSEGGSELVPEQRVGKKRGREKVVQNKDGVEPVEDIVSIPVRTTRSRAQASKKSGVSAISNLLSEKKRARKRSKLGDETVQLTVEVIDLSDNVVSQKAASDQAEYIPSKRSLRKRELGDTDRKRNENMRQKNQIHKAVKDIRKVSEDEPLAKDGGLKEPELCLRRSTRNVVPVRDTTISKRKFDETEMIGRGKTRSRNQSVKQDNDNKTEAAVVQRKTEVLPPAESLRCTGKITNRKSVMPQDSGNVVESPGGSEVVTVSEEPERRPAGKASKRDSIMPKPDEVKATEPRLEKGDMLNENKIAVSHTEPLRRSHRQTSLLEPIAPSDADLAVPVVGGRKRSGKQSYAVPVGNAVAAAARNSTENKQRGDLYIDEPVIDIQGVHSAEESSRRFTRSATKSVGSPINSSVEKVVGKRKELRTVIPNSVLATPSGASAIKEKSLAEAQVSMQEVTEISTDLIPGIHSVIEDNSPKKRSQGQSSRSSKQEGFKEISAKHLEQAKGQTSVSKSKKFHTDGEEKEKETSVRKRIGGHLSILECLEIFPKRLTRSSSKSEKITEWNLPKNSAGKKLPQSSSRPPKLVLDGDSTCRKSPGIDTKFAMPEVLRSPADMVSGSTGVVKVSCSKTITKSSRSTRSSKQGQLQEVHAEASNVDEVKCQLSSSISRKLQTDDRQIPKGISSRKEGGEITFQEENVGIKCTLTAEKSSRRLTRSAFRSNSNAATNLTEKSADKKKPKNRSKTPLQKVKTPSSDRSSSIHGVENINYDQFSLPEAVKGASGPTWEAICGTSSKMSKKVSSSACTSNGDGTELAGAQMSNITNDKGQASNLEVATASEYERLQIDDIETENVVSIKETAIITDTVIAIEDGLTHAINGMTSSTAFSNLGLPNLGKEIALEEGTSTYSIDIMPEVLASSTERSIEIEHTSGQESAMPFTGTAGMSESESKDFEIEVPLEGGFSALEGALNIAAVPEVLGEAIPPVLCSSGIFEQISSSHVNNSSTGSHINEESSSVEVYAETLSLDEKKSHNQKEAEMDKAVDETVDVAENVNIVLGDDKEESQQCSSEMVDEHGPGSHSLEQSGLSGSSEFADQEVIGELSGNRTTSTSIGCLLPTEQSHSLSKVQEMHESSVYAQTGPAASDLFVRDNGVDSLNDQISADCNRLSTEIVRDTFLEDDLHAYNQSGGSRENNEGISMDAGIAEDDNNLLKERNYDEEETENNMELAKSHEFGSSPARQSIDLQILSATSSFAVEELPLQLPEMIGSDNTLSRSSKEPLEKFDAGIAEDGNNLFKERNYDEEETENNMEFAKPHEFGSSPARQGMHLQIPSATSSSAVAELPLQLAEVIGSDNTLSRSSKEPLENFDGTLGLSATSSFSETEKSYVKACNGPVANANVDLVAMNLEKAHDLNFQKLKSEHKLVELDPSLEGNSADHNHNTDAKIVRSLIGCAVIPETVGPDYFGSENKIESAAAKSDFASCHDEQKFMESPELDDDGQRKGGKNAQNNVGESSGALSFDQEKNRGEILGMNDYDGKVSDMGAQLDYAVTGSVYRANATIEKNISHGLPTHDNSDLGTTSKKVLGHSFEFQESRNTVPAEKSQHEESASKENQLQFTCEAMTDGIHSESDQYYQLQNIFKTPVSKDQQECNNTVQLEESQHEDFYCKDNQLQSGEGEDRQPELKMEIYSSVSVEQPPEETEDHMKQISFGTPDRTIHEDEEPFEGFNAEGDTEQYFQSEETENADYEDFGGTAPELFSEAAEMNGHDYTTFDEPGMKDEVNYIEVKNNAVEDDKPVAGYNGKEKERMQSEKAPSDKNTVTEAPSDMSSRTDPSSISDDFATDEARAITDRYVLYRKIYKRNRD